jgi:RNA polymerase sigma factor (sigma-70 family)
MATGKLGTLLRHIHKLASPRGDCQGTDRQLLDDFAARGDEAAFAALVARHGPMVLRVCRRVLNHEQDAEDAFQATFLVLARNTGSIRKREALADWLHGVAYRTAMKAQRSAARRRKHEARLRTLRPEAAPSPRWDEVQPVLDEEIQRLPETFRAAFVLCVLEGKSGPEAAAELGVKEGTVSSRLTRARQRLQRQLARRGIKLAALLAALSVAESAAGAAVPAGLAQAAILSGLSVAAGETAVGSIPSHIAVLAAGVTRAMLLTKAKIATAVLFAVGLLATAGALAHQALGAREKPPPQRSELAAKEAPVAEAERAKATANPLDQAGQTVEVRGRVLDPNGKPVAGATLYLPRALKERPANQDDVALIQRGSTDKDGRFHLKLPRNEAQPGRPVALVATADGFGLDWVELPQNGMPGHVTLRLVKDVPIRGRIVTTEGKPVAGATVAVVGVLAFERLDDFLRAYEREVSHSDEGTKTRRLAVPLSKVLRVTATDKAGRFEVRGVGAERLVGLEVKSAGSAHDTMAVVTRAGLDVKAINRAVAAATARGPEGGRVPLLLGPSFEHVVEPTRAIEGAVREAGSGKPVAGAIVSTAGAGTAVADALGRYRLVGMRKAQEYLLQVSAPKTVPLIGRWVRVPGAPGLEPVRADVELLRGVIVTGRVYDQATGKGVQGQVHFSPLPENKFAAKTPDLALYASADAAGCFRLVTIPGPGVLLAGVPGTVLKIDGVPIYPYTLAKFSAADRRRVKMSDQLKPYHGFLAAGGIEMLDNENACKVLDLKEGGRPVTCDLALDPGKTLTVNLEDPEGKPLAGAVAAGVSAMTLRTVPLKGASGRIYTLDPDDPRPVVFLHAGRKLAAVVTLRGDEKEPVTFRLAPTGVITGRALDVDGRPVAGAEVYTLYTTLLGQQLTRSQSRWAWLPRTDKEGRFRLEGIVPGLKMQFVFRKGRQALAPEKPLHVKALASGKKLDLGDIRTKPRQP